MLDLLIVDDEEATRNGLRDLHVWDELGVDNIYTAPNGQAALLLLDSFVPSILITDIRMPVTDGVELSQRVRERAPDCGIIFLSGYTDKEYLKNAIHVNAVDFLEKPVETGLLKEACKKIIDRMNTMHRIELEIAQKKLQLQSSRYLIRQQLVIELLDGKTAPGSLFERYGHDVYDPGIGSGLEILCVRFNWNPNSKPEETAAQRNDLIKDLNKTEYDNILCGFISHDLFTAIIGSGTEGYPSTGSYINYFTKAVASVFGTILTFSLAQSRFQKSWDLIPSNYQNILEALDMQFYFSGSNLRATYNNPRKVYSYDSSLYKDFKNALRLDSTTKAFEIVDNLTRDITISLDRDISKIKNIYFNLLRILFEVTMHWTVQESIDPTDDSSYIWLEINAQTTLSGLSRLLKSYIDELMNRDYDISSPDKKVDEIRKYIVNNFMDNQLKIKNIADHFKISETYMCSLFKKVTGKTVNGIITELRMEKACDLLRDTRIKLYEITSRVGLIDANYFSVLFKRHTGLTPSEYREKSIYG